MSDGVLQEIGMFEREVMVSLVYLKRTSHRSNSDMCYTY